MKQKSVHGNDQSKMDGGAEIRGVAAPSRNIGSFKSDPETLVPSPKSARAQLIAMVRNGEFGPLRDDRNLEKVETLWSALVESWHCWSFYRSVGVIKGGSDVITERALGDAIETLRVARFVPEIRERAGRIAATLIDHMGESAETICQKALDEVLKSPS